MDNNGFLLVLRESTCGGPGRVELVRYNGTGERVIGYLDPRQFYDPGFGVSKADAVATKSAYPHFVDGAGNLQSVDLGCAAFQGYSARQIVDLSGSLTFDATNGRLLIPLKSYCYPTVFNCNPCPCPMDEQYGGGWWIAAIDGFTSLYEVRQSYTPEGFLGFRVPAVPEGMGGADYFDTYWGDLANPIDFTQAQPLQCNYPASPPHVGDYLTVADPLPNPEAGHGYYYVTAATYQGQTRYGRRASGGRLSGRDPALLPACIQPAQGN